MEDKLDNRVPTENSRIGEKSDERMGMMGKKVDNLLSKKMLDAQKN
jgi:hypothetical protein